MLKKGVIFLLIIFLLSWLWWAFALTVGFQYKKMPIYVSGAFDWMGIKYFDMYKVLPQIEISQQKYGHSWAVIDDLTNGVSVKKHRKAIQIDVWPTANELLFVKKKRLDYWSSDIPLPRH